MKFDDRSGCNNNNNIYVRPQKKYKTLPITLNFKPTQKGGLYA